MGKIPLLIMEKKKVVVVGANPEEVSKLKEEFGDDIELIDRLESPVEEYRLYNREVEYQMDMIQRYDEFLYGGQSRAQREAELQPVRNSKVDPKIGRNEPCPCGSGKKYKHCCSK
mgnify:FL=1